VQGFNTLGDQFPSEYFHLCAESFKRLFTKVAPPNLDRRAIRPRQTGSTVFSRGAKKPNNPRTAVCTSFAFLEKHILLIYLEFSATLGIAAPGPKKQGAVTCPPQNGWQLQGRNRHADEVRTEAR
jgi:hypothetical protein